MKTTTKLILLGILLPSVILHAQSYSIDWYKIGGGGGTSTNGQYSLSGTIGQHDAGGPMSGGNYSVTGGFWACSPDIRQIAAAPRIAKLLVESSIGGPPTRCRRLSLK